MVILPDQNMSQDTKCANTPKFYTTDKDVEIMVPLKYLSNFWRTVEMPLINCEISFILVSKKGF